MTVAVGGGLGSSDGCGSGGERGGSRKKVGEEENKWLWVLEEESEGGGCEEEIEREGSVLRERKL